MTALFQLALTTDLGKGDFMAYWSAVYLLHKGHNPYDSAKMMDVQQTLAHSNLDVVIMTWNPPSLLAILLPLAWFSFSAARAAWFVINVMILLTVSLLLTLLYLPNSGKALVGFCLLAIVFPQALVAITMGQVTFLVLLGVACSMLLIKKEQWFWAGAVLILTTIKPHMSSLVLLYLLLFMAYRRKWQGWVGFLFAGGCVLAVLLYFRPRLPIDYLALSNIAPVDWATPTIGGLLSFLHITEAARYLIVAFFPLCWVLATPRNTASVESTVALLTVITVPTTFFGWSYDQSMLLIPIAHLFGRCWGSSNRWMKSFAAASGVISITLNWIQRVTVTNEVWYCWIPVFWGVLYGICIAKTKSEFNG